MVWFLAHQGGWDEVLLFLAPILIAFIAIRAFERRGRRQQHESQGNAETGQDNPDH